MYCKEIGEGIPMTAPAKPSANTAQIASTFLKLLHLKNPQRFDIAAAKSVVVIGKRYGR